MKRFWLLLLLFVAVWWPPSGATAVSPPALPAWQDAEPTPAPEKDTAAQARALWETMSVEERVGQLFLVTFEGDQVSSGSAITDLILNYHVGSLALDRENNNITGYGNPANAPIQVAELTNSLQEVALLGTAVFTQTGVSEDTSLFPSVAQPPKRDHIPLLIAISQDGDGYPDTQLFNGLTQTPSNLALGATWQPENARITGDVVGRELAALGVNMLIGPVLDVLEKPSITNQNTLGIRVFGGDPYWVGLMGQAYTDGVHRGSHGRVAVIAKHFPGFGASDRRLHDEIPTVQKVLAQLEQVDLAPFIAVTGGAGSLGQKADGLLTAHIRYQGFQGNIRATTNPISLDAQALNTLMQLSGFSSWRQQGGVIVSDVLGVRAVERFYDNTEQEFPHRVVAKDAFLAGNDLLYLADFALGDAPYEQQLANIQDTIVWFQERYRSDVAFQAQVDTAVLRILQMKLRLYDHDFSLENVLIDASPEGLMATVGTGSATMFDVAKNAATLISPSSDVLAERLARPPGPGEEIIIFTDVREAQQCTACPTQLPFSQTALQERILALYGPQSSGQVRPDQITSYSFADLNAFLAAGPAPIIYNTTPVTPTIVPDAELTPESGTAVAFPSATPPPEYLVQESLRNADWIIFAMVDNGPHARALSNFLAQRPDLVRGRQVIAFAYNAPYFLDTTEITQLTAYYGMFSKIDAFIDASVRALFQELPLRGASPINIDAVNYHIFSQTQPAPGQIIPLQYTFGGETVQSSAETDPLPVAVGDTLQLQTGVIIDRNGNPVPDNTIVRFIEWDRIAGARSIIGEAPTRNGVARWDYLLVARTEGGKFRIGVEAGNAVISQELDISVSNSAEGEVKLEIINPTPAPTDTPTPTLMPSPTSSLTPEPTNLPPATPLAPTGVDREPGLVIELSEFLMLMAVTTGLMLVIGMATVAGRRQRLNLEQQLGWLLWGAAGGLLFYLYYALGLPGTAVFTNLGIWMGLVTTLTGGLTGLFAYHLRHYSAR